MWQYSEPLVLKLQRYSNVLQIIRLVYPYVVYPDCYQVGAYLIIEQSDNIPAGLLSSVNRKATPNRCIIHEGNYPRAPLWSRLSARKHK